MALAHSGDHPHPVVRFAETLQGRRWPRPALLGAALAIGVYALANVVRTVLDTPYGTRDFLQTYLLAYAIASGQDPTQTTSDLAAAYGLDASGFSAHPTPHPPTLGLVLVPLSLISIELATAGWLVVSLASLYVAVATLSPVALKRTSVAVTAIGTLLLVAWPPVSLELAHGQVMLVILACLAGMVRSIERGKAGRAGILLGFSMLVKPTGWPLLGLLAIRREWRAAGSAIATFAIGWIGALALVGPDRVVRYATVALPTTMAIYRSHWPNLSVSSLGWRLFVGSDATIGDTSVLLPPVAPAPWLATVLSVLLPLAVLAVAFWWARDLAPGPAFGVVIGASLLVSPVAWPYYLPLVLVPAAYLVERLRVRNWTPVPTNLALLAVLTSSIPQGRLLSYTVEAIRMGHPVVTIPPSIAIVSFLPAVAIVLTAWLCYRFADPSNRTPRAVPSDLADPPADQSPHAPIDSDVDDTTSNLTGTRSGASPVPRE